MISNLREGGGDDRDDNLPGYGVQPEPGPLGVGSDDLVSQKQTIVSSFPPGAFFDHFDALFNSHGSRGHQQLVASGLPPVDTLLERILIVQTHARLRTRP